MNALKKAGRVLYRIYTGIGIAAIVLVAIGVIFTVIMRYCFNISFAFLEETITLTFTFTTFWGIGVCILEDEHVVIDFLFQNIPVRIKHWLDAFINLVVLITLSVLQYYTIGWIAKAGKILSNGMRVQYYYIYSVMPIGVAAGLICCVVKLVSVILNKPLNLRPAKAKNWEDNA